MDRLKKIVLDNKTLLTAFIAYCGVFLFFTYFYYQRLAAFGCFDDCFNYMGGYFLLNGKEIYVDFFFNHSFLLPFISFLIQKISQPSTIYSLILIHKIFLFLFSFAFGILLILRFRIKAALALIFFEATKFYVFGDHFLGESFIIYPLMYLVGIVWEKVNERELSKLDYILAGVFGWFCAAIREPYAPLSIILLLMVLVGRKDLKKKAYSLAIFVTLSLVSILTVSVKDFLLNVYFYNKEIIGQELRGNNVYGLGILNTLSYPLRIFTEGENNLLRQILIFFSAVFLSAGIFYSFKLKRVGFIIMFIILAISNIRPTVPGKMFYEAYHMNVWYGLFIFVTFLIVFELFNAWNKKLRFNFLMPFFVMAIFIFISPSFFIWEKIDRVSEFNTNYAQEFTYGSAIKLLSKENDTIFVEERDDLIYWIANRPSAYQHTWYTAHMPLIDRFKEDRLLMFESKPPDFYFDACFGQNKKHRAYLLEIEQNYERLSINGNPSCLLIKNSTLKEITKEKWNSVKPLGFTLNIGS
ncbi:MAG: hypothetical protein HYW63_03290 [Candidatus Levybacteria bacterium]|nr:hypothetical protein [Candidatus Levybacteria bacterium]